MWSRVSLVLVGLFDKQVFAQSTQNCIWVRKEYFPACPYAYHHINQERELNDSQVFQETLRVTAYESWPMSIGYDRPAMAS